MSSVTLTCPHCREVLEAPVDMIGIEVECPCCNQSVVVPAKSMVIAKKVPAHKSATLTIVLAVVGTALVMLILFVGLALLAGFKGEKSSDGTASGSTSLSSRQMAHYRTAIEAVLQKDATASQGTTTVADILRNMRKIDTSECPANFRSAYLGHLQAWEAGVELQQRVDAFNAEREGAGDMIEGFIRGALGDPAGKYNEVREAGDQLNREMQAARNELRSTYGRVEQVAVSYGARLPTR